MYMNDNLKYYLIYSVLYGIILLAGEAIYRYLHVNPARSRNFSHLAAGLVSLPYPWLFSSHWWVLLIAVQSSLVLFLTRHYGLIRSHHQSAGKGVGSFLFFVSVYICFLATGLTGYDYLYVIPILVLTISDVSASIIGQKYGRNPMQLLKIFGAVNKTRAGSLAFFMSSFIVVFAAYSYFLESDLIRIILLSLFTSTVATLSEAISPNGYDNFLVPVSILIILRLDAFI